MPGVCLGYMLLCDCCLKVLICKIVVVCSSLHLNKYTQYKKKHIFFFALSIIHFQNLSDSMDSPFI